MSIVILLVFLFGLYIRNMAFQISIVNECKLKFNKAIEYGEKNSMLLGVFHTLLYGGCIVEAFIRKTQFDFITIVGIILYCFSFVMLFYVIKQLNGFWTTKVILAEDHKLNTNFLFRYIKHPNYFLNLIPELVGFALVCKAIYVFSVIFPLFLITLIVRISIEEKVLRSRFENY